MEKKRAILCVGIIFALNVICIIPIAFLWENIDIGVGSMILMATAVVFMWFPVIAVVITRKITKDNFKVGIRPYFKKNIKYYLQACLFPGIFTCIGAVIYFVLFPETFDLTLAHAGSLMGVEVTLPFTLTIPLVLLFAILIIVIAPLVIINHVFAFGEEFGWRGYILPKLQTFMSDRKAVIINGVLWGLGHAPLVCFGLHYNFDYIGFPYTGIIMMTIFATVLGIWLSYLTIKTKSVVAASIAHGAINSMRELPAFIAVSGINVLIGPKSSGIVGMIGFIILALVCFYHMKNRHSKDDPYPAK